jgi:acetylornithine/N-succinyldiaminopimelate aminotransferase
VKELSPTPPAVVHNETARIQSLFSQYVVPTYGRFEVALSHGSGSYVYDVAGKRYLDIGGGIAVLCLGHANPEILDALTRQAQKLVHVSNLYYNEPQGRLAQALVKQIAPGKLFFCNSGAEANEGLFKLARKFGHDEGRYEVLTTINSFHGRTLAGIAATGQEKVKKGFEPSVPGFRHVPYNNLEAMREAISPGTAAILIEGVQGEGGVTPASAEYLLGLRKLCDEKRLLLMMDSVQCGHFRTGRYQSFQRTLESVPGGEKFVPDAISMAKSLGGGLPIGAFWVREPYADLLGAGSHGTTFGGTPLMCAVALRIMEVIEREKLVENIRQVGDYLKSELLGLSKEFPSVISNVRGLGFILGIELATGIRAFSSTDKPASIQMVNRLHDAGLLTIPAGNQVIRVLPPYNLRRHEAEEALAIIRKEAEKLAASGV